MRPFLSHQNSLAALARRAWLVIVIQMACAGPGPTLFPPAPLETRHHDDGSLDHLYDIDHDGQPDLLERRSPAGRVTVLQYLHDTHPATSDHKVPRKKAESTQVDTPKIISEETIRLDRIPNAERRHLLIILDSVPYQMVRDLWNQGRFRLFHPPARVISPFPVMTDLSLSEFFGASPCLGVESQYYDGRHLTNGYLSYADEVNTPWLAYTDYHLSPIAHSEAYGHPYEWFDHELRQIQDRFLDNPVQNNRDAAERAPHCFVGYCVGTSALGARFGRNGHLAGLIRLDRFCQSLFFATHGRVQITLLSDHGHNLVHSRRIPLSEELQRFGYHTSDRLVNPYDVVVPEFGVVTYAAIHTHQPASVARDVIGIEGIDLAAYRNESDQVVVLSRQGRAVISHRKSQFRVRIQTGAPLGLSSILHRLQREHQVDPDGFVEDRLLFDATVDGDYPDGIHRLWRAFHGLVENTPDVLISVKDGWHCGSPFMTRLLDLAAAHGNLNPLSSTAFVMTTAGTLPSVLRMENLRHALIKLGVPLAIRETSRQDNGTAGPAGMKSP